MTTIQWVGRLIMVVTFLFAIGFVFEVFYKLGGGAL